MTRSFRSFAIIPACGESRRMGTDKLLLPWQGSTILETVIAAWQKSNVDHIFVVIPKQRTDLQKVLQVLPVHIVLADPRPVDMKGSIQVALRVIEEQCEPTPDDAWLVAPADMPTLSTVTIDQVLKVARKLPGVVVSPVHQKKHGHPVSFPWKLAGEVFQLGENDGLNTLVDKYVGATIAVKELGEDADTTEELKALHMKAKTNSPQTICGNIELIQEEYDRGRLAAEQAFAKGQRKMYVQTRGAWGRFLFDLMKHRYGIFVEHISDITSAEKLSYEAGYNSVAHQYVDTLDGEGTMQQIWEEVQTFRQEQYRKYLKENQK